MFGAPEVSGVGGDEDVGGALGAFYLESFEEGVGLSFKDIDVDIGFILEEVVEVLVGWVVSAGVDVE